MDGETRGVAAERDENTCRLNFLPTEAVALGEALERIERPKAEERQAKAGPKSGKGKKRTGSGKLPEPVVVGSDTRDVVGKATGTSGKTYERAKAVVEAARGKRKLGGKLPPSKARTYDIVGKERRSAKVGATCPHLLKPGRERLWARRRDAGRTLVESLHQ